MRIPELSIVPRVPLLKKMRIYYDKKYDIYESGVQNCYYKPYIVNLIIVGKINKLEIFF